MVKKEFLIFCFFVIKVSVYAQNIKQSNYNWKDGFYELHDLTQRNPVLIIYDKAEKKYFEIDSLPAVALSKTDSVRLVYIKADSFRIAINIRFNETGKNQFSKLTRNTIGHRIGFVIDNELIFAPTILDQIDDGFATIFSNDIQTEILYNKIKEKILIKNN